MSTSEFITHVHSFVFPNRICRACLLVDSDAKYVEIKNKYDTFKELLGVEIDPLDLDNSWLCFICVKRISNIEKFCFTIRRANHFLKLLSGQMKNYTNHDQAATAGLESLYFFNFAANNLTVEKLPQIDVRLSADISIKSEVSDTDYEQDCAIVASESPIKVENLQDTDIRHLERTEVNAAHQNYDLHDNEYDSQKSPSEDDSCSSPPGDESAAETNHEQLSSRSSVEPVLKKRISTSKKGKEKSSKVILLRIAKDQVLKQFKKKALDEKYINAKHKCTFCLKVFTINSALTAHMEGHNESKGDYECVVCHLRFKHLRNLKTHHYIHRRRYKCAKCDYTATNNICVMEHYSDVHDKLSLGSCERCGRLFKTSSSKRMHVCQQKAECDQCGKIVSKSYLGTHMERVHCSDQLFICQTCNKKFASEKLLFYHSKNTHVQSTEPLYCIECDMTFVNKNTMSLHMNYSSKHIKEENLKSCPHCPRLLTYWQLKPHIHKEHSEVKSYPCEKCTKTFRTRHYLKDHTRKIHDGKKKPKNFVCDICGHPFSGKKLMLSHMNTHTGARPYKCPLCPATFGHSATLFTHNKLVHLKQKRNLPKKKLSNEATAIGTLEFT